MLELSEGWPNNANELKKKKRSAYTGLHLRLDLDGYLP